MTFTEKFANLTPEHLEKFNALKDGAGLDALLTESGIELTAEEKTKVLEYIESGKLSLADEELDNVAGGIKFPSIRLPKLWDNCSWNEELEDMPDQE